MAEEKKEEKPVKAKPGIKSTEMWFSFGTAVAALIVGILAGFGYMDPESSIGAIIAAVAMNLNSGAYAFGRSMVKKKELEK